MTEQLNQVPRHFVVLVPGYMGSKLRDRTTGEIIWVDFSALSLWNALGWKRWLNKLFQKMSYPNNNLEPAGIMDQVLFLLPWAKQKHYNRLVQKLMELGYDVSASQCFGGNQSYNEKSLNVYAFAYDWRQDNRASAKQLGEAIDRWRAYHTNAEVWIIAHSNGGLVARWYIEKMDGKKHVRRLFLMGSPWDGTPKAMYLLFNGFDTLFRRALNWFDIPKRTRKLVRTFPSAYQLIPYVNPFLKDPGNEPVNPFTANGWLGANERQLLQDGEQFNKDLGPLKSDEVETICFFGTKHRTPTSGRVKFAAANKWSSITWEDIEEGDGTIPVRSAVHPHADEKIPYPVSHGDIYVDEAVLEKLQYEMIDKYRLPVRATTIMAGLLIVFEPDKDIYSPGEEINLWAKVAKLPEEATDYSDQVEEKVQAAKPLPGAGVEVILDWEEPLPGMEQAPFSLDFEPVPLWESAEKTGEYEGTIRAPEAEGYYKLVATVTVEGELRTTLEELIAVEAIRDPEIPDQEQLV